MRKKLLASLSVATALLFATPVSALTYTPVSGSTVSFNTYFIVHDGENVPSALFRYSVAPGTGVAPTLTTMEVFAGTGTPTVSPATFTCGQGANTTVTTESDVARADRTNVRFDTGEKFATAQSTVDFSSVSYTKPGIYRYVLSEDANSADASKGVVHDDDTDRILDVYVTDSNGDLAVSAYVLHEDASVVYPVSQLSSQTLTDKSDGFTNEYKSKDIVFRNEVTGNQASRDKYFAYTLTLGNLTQGDTYIVSLSNDSNATTTDGNADATSGTTESTRLSNRSQTNVTSLTASTSGVTQTFYLQHGQSIAVRGLPADASYNVTVDAEDYQISGTVAGYTAPAQGVVGSVAGMGRLVLTSFKLTRNGIIPTGVFTGAGMGIAILIIGIVGITIMSFWGRRRK